MRLVPVLLSLIFGLILLGPVRADRLPLVLVTEEWAPYNFTDADGRLTGFSTEIIRAIMRELREDHEIRVYPGPRTTLMLDRLPNAMGFSYYRTPKREKKYKWIGPLVRESMYVFKHHDDTRQFQTMEDLRHVGSIVLANKGIIQDRFEVAGFRNLVRMTDNREQIRRVLLRRSDLLANFTPLGLAYYLREMDQPTDALVRTNVKLVDLSLSIAVSREIPDSVVLRWQEALDWIRLNGTYDRIYREFMQ